jgi:hypothetical protein
VIGAEQVTGGGYDVALKFGNADQYAVWSTDSNGTYVANLIGVVSGNSTALETMETTLHQNLNSDGMIGIPASSHAVLAQYKSPEDNFKFTDDTGGGTVASNPPAANQTTTVLTGPTAAPELAHDNFDFAPNSAPAMFKAELDSHHIDHAPVAELLNALAGSAHDSAHPGGFNTDQAHTLMTQLFTQHGEFHVM